MKKLNYYLFKPVFLYYAFFLVISPCMFLANITPFSPAYFLFAISFLLFVILLVNNSKLYLDNDLRFLIAIILAIGIYRLVNYCIFPSELKNNLLQFLSFFYFFSIIISSKKIDSKTLLKFLYIYFFIADAFLFFDFCFRFIRRSNEYSGILFFYNFKRNGLMFQDSNFSAFLGMINFGGKLYVKYKTNKKTHLFRTIVLTVLNLSRASWVGLIIAILVYTFFKSNKRKRVYQILFYIAIFILVCGYVFTKTITDYSFLTKFQIFDATFNILRNSTLFNFFFGHGVESSKDILDISLSAHNYFSRDFIELGFIAVFLHTFLYICILIVSKGAFAFILFPYLVAGLSMGPSVMPYFFALAGCILLFERKNKYLLERDSAYEK